MPGANVLYPSFNYLVSLMRAGGQLNTLGGFSDASGLEASRPLRRNGGALHPGHKAPKDVTLRRGVVNAGVLWQWMLAIRTNAPTARRDLQVTLRDQTGAPVMTWSISKALVVSYLGPALGSRFNSADVAIENIVLSHEGFELQPPN